MKELYKKNLQNETFLQLNRFILVGVLNTVITITIFLFLTNFVKLDYRLSNSIGYIIGVINSFIWNKKWTFKTKNSLKSEFLKFIVVFIISYFINFLIVIYFKEHLRFNKNISQMIGIIFYTLSFFIGSKIFVFKKKVR